MKFAIGFYDILLVEDHGAILMAEAEIDQTNGASPEMELHITQILEKWDNFTNMVSELLESGKTMFKELRLELESRKEEEEEKDEYFSDPYEDDLEKRSCKIVYGDGKDDSSKSSKSKKLRPLPEYNDILD
uniref:Uncharacterized protein n=1 Tax=Cannabis sativa TaxID=3483 RepID=A0A803QDS8_CANSA